MSKLKVENLPHSVTSKDLEDRFSAYGTVKSATVIEDRHTGRPMGYGFVEFATAAEAEAAIKHLNNHVIDNRAITVSAYQPPSK